MEQNYNHQEIEPKWQKKWAEAQVFKADNNSRKEKKYVLDIQLLTFIPVIYE